MPGEGVTEQIIGRWFARGDGRREKTVIATKLYGSMSEWPNDTFLSARNIRLACDASLKRLQTDYIDLYQMHHVDRSTPWDEIWEAFEVLRQQGKVLYFGSSNHAGWHIAQSMETARRRQQTGLVSEQSIYNLLKRDVELEVLPGLPGLRPRRHPVVAAQRRAARRHHPQDREGPAPAHRPRQGRAQDPPQGAARPTRTSATSSASCPPTSGWRGCCTRRA